MKNLISILLFATFSLTHAEAKNLLQYENTIRLSQYRGTTFFSLMRTVIKPQLDEISTTGFHIASGEQLKNKLKLVDEKVANKAIQAAGGLVNLLALADELNQNYDLINFYQLPATIAELGYAQGQYDLATFLSLISGGGVAVEFNDKNTAYNVNYGSGEYDKDEMTGRSFGESTQRLSLDASDKHYLASLERYVRTEKQNVPEFYRSILMILLNNDASWLSAVSPAGQVVAADFLAVYIAEQDRHLMSQMQSHPWDEALLEVTLLSALHSGQEKVMLVYNGEFTDTTLKQASGCQEETREEKAASMVDYWQFSKSTDPENCRRSGINITRKDFRMLGAMITSYQRQAHPELVQAIEKDLGLRKESQNLFADLSSFIVNQNTAKSLGTKAQKLAEDMTNFLMQVQADAEKIAAR